MNQFDELPEGWINVHLQDLTLDPRNEIVDGPFGSNLRASEYQHKGIPIIRLQNIDRNFFIEKNIKYISIEKSEELKRHSFISGDIVITKLGDPLGKACLVPSFLNFGIIVADIVRVRISEEFSNKIFLMNFINSPLAISQLEKQTKGTTRSRVNLNHIRSVEIPLPPFNEQRRIVEKIEALTARSRKAREALEAIPNLLDQFRQSVLAAAFRGDLTADWREQNPNVDKFWHQNLITSFRDSLEASKRQGRLWGSGTFAQEVDESWGEIPDSWNWVKVIDLGYNPDEVVQIGPMSMKSNEFVDEGTIVLNVGCVQWSGINLDKCNFLPPDRASDFERYRVKANDILFTRSGEVGRSAIVPDELDSSLMTFHLLRVRTMSDICIPEYLFLCFRGCSAVKHQIEKSTIGATRAGFNTKLLQNIWLPLPSIKEQAEVLLQIRQRLSKITLLETQLAEFSEDLNQLDQSILAKAFRGELVPQDPNDEPANLLLERIRAERERLGNSKKRGKAKT